MRKPRIKLSGRSAVYHCMARVVGGQRLLKKPEKERLRRLLWEYADFCGLEVLTYCLMSNHFHVLVRVPGKITLSDAQLIGKVRALHGPKSALFQGMEAHYEKQGHLPGDVRSALLARMGDVSVFMKELKQRLSKWYNKQHDRFGTLWAERFKSVLVEDTPHAVSCVAMYIDLNPVRAGILKDPKDYRFCGYAQALAGHGGARQGLMSFHPPGAEWRQVARTYRKALLIQSATSSHSDKVVLDRKVIQKKLSKGAQLSRGEVLRLKIRYMSEGLILGSRNFVNEIFTQYRDRFGPKRKDGARKLRLVGPALGDLTAARDLQKAVIE